MSQSGSGRREQGSRGRIKVEFDGPLPEADSDGEGSGNSSGPGEVVLRSGALLRGSERIPIPVHGMVLGHRSDRPFGNDEEPAAARVDPTEGGHVLVSLTDLGDVYLNGERMVEGERRPLAQGDSVAVDDELYHYLPSGASATSLPAIVPVSAGRIRSRRAEMVIGRDQGCDLTLDYPTVDLKHAVIKTSPDGSATIEDKGSTTGLRVNGVTVRRTRLEPGDEIAIGPYRIIFDGEELVERAAADGLPVEARGVTVTMEETTILQPTDLNLRGGELVAFIGESGAGKTTLLKLLAGVSEPTTGQVLCGGEPVRARMSEIGYVPQFDIVHGELTVFEALDFAAQLRLPSDTSEVDRHQRIREVIEQLGLTERAELPVQRLSGGQRKRVAVGIELLHRPGAIFLDEPTTGLDPGLERMMMVLFRELADAGQTVVLVTHATGSMSLCDRVVVMGRGGVKRFDGEPDELLDAFGVDHFDDVYAELASGAAPRVTIAPPGEQATALSGRVRPKVHQSFAHQTRVLATRYATLMGRGRRNLISLAIQTVVLGLLTAMIFSGDVLEFPPAADKALTGKAAQLIFLMVTISIWMGSISSAREIVKERSVIAREMAVGVGVNAYIASKLVILLALVSVQIFAFFLIVSLIKPLGAGDLTVLVVLIVSSWIAVLLGLAVSAYAQSEDQATGLIPILLVPQLLFGGALVTLNEMPAAVRTLADIVPSRWSYDAAGTAVDMATRIEYVPAGDGSNATATALQQGYGPDFFHLEAAQYLLVAAIFFAALYLLVRWLILRPRAED